jgi:hypothetical protein
MAMAAIPMIKITTLIVPPSYSIVENGIADSTSMVESHLPRRNNECVL